MNISGISTQGTRSTGASADRITAFKIAYKSDTNSTEWSYILDADGNNQVSHSYYEGEAS